MTLSQIADFADLLAAFGIIVTLAFLAFEIRKNSRQAKINNWHLIMQSIKEIRRRTDDPHVADVIARGRRDFNSLSEPEQITFGNYLEEQLLDYDPFLVHGNEIAVGEEHARRAALGAFQDFLGSPGARDWWLQSEVRKRWPPHLVSAIEDAVASSASQHP